MTPLSLSDSYNRDLLDQMYTQWSADPNSVDPTWQAFFGGVEFAGNGISRFLEPGAATATDSRLQTGVVRMINWYRQVGHLQAHIDPLENEPPAPHPLLALSNFGLSEEDLGETVDASMVFGLNGPAKLREVRDVLKATYCGRLGVEFMHIDDLAKRVWFASRMEPTRNKPALTRDEKLAILGSLYHAQNFENYLQTKYTGQKRFSLEGGETLMPVLDAIVNLSPSLGIQEIVLGMAHRGRLNVLTNLLHKPVAQIFNEFEDHYLPETTRDGDGDVKYHMGHSADIATPDGGSVHLSLSPNPSHLEAVNPVVEGRVRAKQRMHGDAERGTGIPLLIHGDAAFMGQGPVAETLNMANLTGYRTGGTMHVVINNQIGFTTAPRDARSTQYCTDLAKFIQAPIFHVHGEDPEAAVMLARLALEYRQQFKCDAVLDIVCYRKFGHNEGDEPSFTQPIEYRKIRAKTPVAEVYAQKLLAEGVVTPEEVKAITEEFRNRLDASYTNVKAGPAKSKRMVGFTDQWRGFTTEYSHKPAETAITREVARRIGDQFARAPEGFEWHPTILKLAEKRRADTQSDDARLDWNTGEALAFGSLVLERHTVRLSGQDSRRGTFSQRHSTYFDQKDGTAYTPLDRLAPDQAPFDAFDSSLSEAAVLGFEYGYTLDDPNALVMWEAQFGDFSNGAQVIIDQFIASGESKWNRSSGLVLLLPHGHEGQGPEHTSARLERFLQLCAEDNIQVANLTTPANYFHALRRQLKRNFRKPLVIMTPKSLLRFAPAASPLADFVDGSRPAGKFQEVIDDPAAGDAAAVKRVVLCSGKVYYDLSKKRADDKLTGVAIVRVEQLYPWPEAQLKAVLSRYAKATEFVWAQEESQNNGAWFFVAPLLKQLGYESQFVGRDASASPATGSAYVHAHEQADLVEAALTKPAPYQVLARKKPGAKPAATATTQVVQKDGDKGTANG